MVRKAALQAVQSLIQLCPDVFLKAQYLDVLSKHALDPSVANRKQALTSLIQLMNTYTENDYV